MICHTTRNPDIVACVCVRVKEPRMKYPSLLTKWSTGIMTYKLMFSFAPDTSRPSHGSLVWYNRPHPDPKVFHFKFN